MEINLQRLIERLEAVGGLGRSDRPERGIDRMAFSEDYYRAISLFGRLLKAEGLSPTQDRVGNLIARRPGLENDLPAIGLGSHMDTVTDGGLYDGALGCLVALECMAVLRERGITTRHPIEVIAFNAEEGGPMGGTFGSRAMMGKENALDQNARQNMPAFGITPEDVLSVRRDPAGFHSFLELHIEQGSVLEREGLDMGIVTGIVGITRCQIVLEGASNHAGTTPMGYRRDALVAAARLICQMQELATRYPEPFVFTIGNLEVFPGMATVIPGRVNLQLEMRDLVPEHIEDFISRTAEAAAALPGIKAEIKRQISKPPAVMDERMIALLEEVGTRAGVSLRRMASGAGHDAQVLAGSGVPTGMIFLPSKDGISHNPAEFTHPDFIKKGAQVMLEALLRLDAMDLR
jgi:hydantoinase/carbamoylase family amidase